MNANSDVSTCAVPGCGSKFQRLGDGALFVSPISDPKAWGLPPNVKQKVIWLCDGCCREYHVRFDRRHHLAQLVRKPITRKVA